MSGACSSSSAFSSYGPRIIGLSGNAFGGSSFTYESSRFVKLFGHARRMGMTEVKRNNVLIERSVLSLTFFLDDFFCYLFTK